MAQQGPRPVRPAITIRELAEDLAFARVACAAADGGGGGGSSSSSSSGGGGGGGGGGGSCT